MAVVQNLSALAERHKAVAGASLPIACRAEAGDVVQLHEPAHHLIQGAAVADIELCGIVVRCLWHIVTAHTGAGTAADLGDAQREDTFPHGLALSCGDDHTGIRNCHTNQSTDLGENVVADAVVEVVRIDVLRRFDAGDADGVGADTVYCFQMFSVHQQPHQLVGIIFQPEQNAKSHIVDTASHGTIHCLGVVVVVVFRPGGMELFVTLLVVSFLKENIGADASFFQHVVFLFSGRCNVDIHTADGTVLVTDVIDGVDALQNVGDRVVQRVFAGFNGESFVSHVL